MSTLVRPRRTHHLDVRDFGAVGNGTTDDTAAIQAAIDAAETAGGGVVFLPTGTYRLTDSLVIDTLGIPIGLRGPVGSGWAAWGAPTGGAVLDWQGGSSPMLIIRPAVSSGLLPAVGHTLENLSFKGNDAATQCIHVEAARLCVFRNLSLYKTTDAAFYTGGTAVSGFTGNHHTYNCVLENISVDQSHGAATGRGMSLGTTSPDGRFFFNSLTNVNVVAGTGIGIDIIAADHCTFSGINSAGSTYGVVLEGLAVNFNVFLNLWPGTGGVLARGTADGTGGASNRNTIYGYSTSDDAPLPTIRSGASLFCYYDTGRPTPLRSLAHTSNGSNTDYYVKLASGSITAQYDQHSGSCELSSYAGGTPYMAHVDFRVYMASAINGSNQPSVTLLVQQKTGWVAADISIVVTNVTTTVDWELWAKLPSSNTTVLVTPQVEAIGHINWLESQTPVSARTSGTATGGTSV